MFWIVLGMMLAVALAALVLAIVALPARRAGRPLLTPRGEKFFRRGGTAVPRSGAEDDATPAPGERSGAKARRSSRS